MRKKKQYLRIGTLITKDDGAQSIKIDCIPTEWNGWASVYDQKEKNNTQDDMPF